MKNQLFLFISLLSFLTTNGQETNSYNKNIINSNIDREFFIEKQLDLYTVLPSTLSLWSHSDWSVISFKGNYDEGDFKTVDECKNNKLFTFNTQSVQSFKQKKLKLYGSFSYSTGEHEEAGWNQFYKKSDIGSPFRIVTERIGDWRTKHYGISGIITKKISNRLELGLSVKYDGDLYLRTLDTRNEQYNLKINALASASYSLNNNRYLSIGIAYQRRKSKPEFRNSFKGTEEEYYLHPTKGFGDFDAPLNSSTLVITDQNPSYTLAYHSGRNNKFSASYTVYIGQENWKRLNTAIKKDESDILYKYDYHKHNLLGSHLINAPKYHLLSKVKFELISGKAYTYEQGYRDASIYDGISLSSSIDLLRNNKKFFDQTGIELNIENISKKDLTTAHLMEYTNLKVDVYTGFHFPLNSLNKIKFTLKGGYKYNLSHTHHFDSAKDMEYTINLAHNEMAYHTSDYYHMGGKCSWFHQFEKSGIEWALNFSRINPTNIKISNQYSLLKKSTNRTYIGLNFNLIF